MAEVLLKNVSKIYDSKHLAVKDSNVEIKDKEFVVLVGPSGCGKSTLLRMIAGLEEITSGEIYIDGKIVNNVPPKDRDIAMVFQNYALYPHMTVFENIAFGLKLRKLDKEEINRRVNEAVKILDLKDYLDRKPKQLSGGQRQRVAVGRSIVRKPKVFLFDEPLSNLDAKLRAQMRTEISRLHKRLGATIIYVTHDQTEAMTMGDKIVVLKNGRVQQVGEPMSLYNKPANQFVAGFIGSPSMNFISGKIVDLGKLYFVVDALDIKIELDGEQFKKLHKYMGEQIIMGIRPENISLEYQTFTAENNLVHVDVVEPMGNETLLYFNLQNNQMIARGNPKHNFKAGVKLALIIDNSKMHFFDKTNGIAI